MFFKDYNSFFIGLFASIVFIFFLYNAISFIITLNSDNDENNQKIAINTWIILGFLVFSSLFVIASVSFNAIKQTYLKDVTSRFTRPAARLKSEADDKDNPLYLNYKQHIENLVDIELHNLTATDDEKNNLQRETMDVLNKKIDSLYPSFEVVYIMIQRKSIMTDGKEKEKLERLISKDMARIDDSVASSIPYKNIIRTPLVESIKKKKTVEPDKDGDGTLKGFNFITDEVSSPDPSRRSSSAAPAPAASAPVSTAAAASRLQPTRRSSAEAPASAPAAPASRPQPTTRRASSFDNAALNETANNLVDAVEHLASLPN